MRRTQYNNGGGNSGSNYRGGSKSYSWNNSGTGGGGYNKSNNGFSNGAVNSGGYAKYKYQ